MSAVALATRLEKREVSSVELVRASFDAIRAQDGTIGAFVELDEKGALRAAEAADRRRREGGSLPRLFGMPTAIKDHEHVRFMRTRVGSRALSFVLSPVDGMLARRCRGAGMVILGKTSTSELTILPFIDGHIGPPTRSPVAPDCYGGGSSGGAAAAVAASMIPIAPGSDGAGSIRVPASFCGLFGFKPGRYTLFHAHSDIDTIDLSAIGPLAKDVRDAAAMLDLLAEGTEFTRALTRRPRGLRVRLGLKSPLAIVDPEVEAATRKVGRILEALGHHVDEGGALDAGVDEFLPLMGRMVAKVPLLPFTNRLLEPTTVWLRSVGARYSDADIRARKEALERRVDAWYGDADAWVLPTSAVLPPRVGQYRGLDGEATMRAVVPIGAFTAPFNVSGQPACSIPAGTSNDGRPIGVQLVMKRGDDRRLLALAADVEEALA